MTERFEDRRDAGARLARVLERFRGADVRVLGLPRGGVPVAFEVARALDAPLDVFLVRKLGAPGHEELAMGAIASGGAVVLERDVVRTLGVTQAELTDVAQREAAELARRELAYRGARAPLDVRGRTVLLVDDGLATGASMKVAVLAVRRLDPARIVIAVPVASRAACEAMRDVADEVVCAWTPSRFRAVGLWYDDFAQVTDDEVVGLLAAAAPFGSAAPSPSTR